VAECPPGFTLTDIFVHVDLPLPGDTARINVCVANGGLGG
jgi:hypothetical protein